MFTKRAVLPSFIFLLLIAISKISSGQTQKDFENKYSEVYQAGDDKKKALMLAKEAYQMLERKKELQTYTNYYILKSIFENQSPEPLLAKACGEKADKLMRATVGLDYPPANYGNDSANLWYNTLYPQLYQTTDPENANKAVTFLDIHTSFRSAANYNGVAYAYERNGDFVNAKKYYEYSFTYVKDEQTEYVSYLTYILFLAKSGDYQKAEELIKKVEHLEKTASEMLRQSYRMEALSAHTLYSFYTGDYEGYLKFSDIQNKELAKSFSANKIPCSGQEYIRFTNAAVASEFLKDYYAAERYWKSRDSAYEAWIKCQRGQYPNLKLYEFSMWPVFMVKRGKEKQITKPLSFYIDESKKYYSSFEKYADNSTNYFKAIQLAFLKSPEYKNLFPPLLDRIKTTRDFRESTRPFSDFAYFNMRDRQWEESRKYYEELFSLNTGWINDIIFSFGERAFVMYYNAKLKEGYENFHSYVKLAKEKGLSQFYQLAGQAYNNLLFTKSISLQGTKKRKEAFLKSNDPATVKLYESWLDKKQQLIRLYFKSSEPVTQSIADTSTKIDFRALQDEVAAIENDLANKGKDFKKLLRITPSDWKEIKAKLKEGEAAVELIRFQWKDQVYYSDTSFYAAYIITYNSSNPDVVYLPAKPAEMDDKFYKVYKNNIRFKTDDNSSYNVYWKAIGEKLQGIKKVYISPDGIYHLINLSTLKNPASGRYVLDEIQIQPTTSCGDIALLNNKESESHLAVLFGRPSYKTSGQKGSGSLSGNTRSFVNSFKETNISDLPGTETEVLSIKAEMEKNNISVSHYLKEEATEDKLYQLHNPAILHIATHGYWAGTGNGTDGFRLFNAMANSGLLLSGVVNYYSAAQYPDTYDGVLTAYEAQNLDLTNTSLVVLSACETTLGYLDAGEGVYGLQRAFRAAGASSIMTSLWKVDDAATKDFMIVFYQHYLKHNDLSAAFSNAQKMIRDKYIHPYYWGAFVLVSK